ncbi:MAG TPA: hypothetical protein VMN36_07080 [Verrucomicrobiales bacterium]|nr:hypothetical protein [Verrucomicrobiales bacterium]
MTTSAWISTLPPEAVSDSAVTALLDAIPDDPGGALLCSLQLDDPGIRLSRAREYAVSAYEKDPESFVSLFNALSFSDEERALILGSLSSSDSD